MPYSRIQYLCWLFSGAEISLLKECPTDYNRQASIGFTILMTCLFAGFAGGFAAWRFSGGNIFATVIFGIIWALLIFSIDRSMVVTLKKDPTKKEGRWVKIAAFAARAVLSGLLAFMISIPLEIYIFKDEIGIQLQQDDVALATDQQQKWEKQLGLGSAEKSRARSEAERDRNERLAQLEPQTPEYRSAKDDVAKYQQIAGSKRRDANKIDLNRLENRIPLNEEGAKVAGAAYDRWRRAVRIRKEFLQAAAAAESKIQQNRATMRELAIAESNTRRIAASQAAAEAQRESNRIKGITDSLAVKDKGIKKALAQKGFLREYVALTNASKDPKKGELGFLLWLIRGIMFVIELLPTIVKLATPIGEYDRQLHAHEQLFALALRTNYTIMEGRERLRQQTEQRIAEQLEQARLDRELELGKNVLEKTATYQNDLAERMLKDWHKQEREKQKAASVPKASTMPPVTAHTSAPQAAPQQPAAATAAPAATVVPSNTPPTPSASTPAATTSVSPSPIGSTIDLSLGSTGAPLPGSGSTAQTTPPPIPTTASSGVSSVTLAALTTVYQWKIDSDPLRKWYRFENGSTKNRVRRYLGSKTETGTWSHPDNDTSRLRIAFDAEMQDYIIQRLTNTEMVLRNADNDHILAFSSSV
jgi:hypothetical protein